MTDKVPGRRERRKGRIALRPFIPDVPSFQSNNLRFQIRRGKGGSTEPRARLTRAGFQINGMRGRIMTDNGFGGGRIVEHIQGELIPIVGKGHVGVNLHEPGFAVP